MKLSKACHLFRVFWLRRKWNKDKKERIYFNEIFKGMKTRSGYYWFKWMMDYSEIKEVCRILL